ncbi:MAG: YeeE/YedE thiosulfate transporter family protein [Bacteroidetes bacterium]|nr:YeeE/YedE thiosulfate transporter family protein [Bacteroidota bacterium]MDA1121392.1 YeeE/YedE thiosulfate transporter family protein [Bacteroidota bacterium]
MKNIKYLLLGTVFGFILTKTEVISWFRIQEMFRFQSFHMYGVIGSALVMGVVSLQIMKKLNMHASSGGEIKIEGKDLNYGTAIGGLIFGLGWAITGACPGPIFALIGNGHLAFIVVLLSAIGGTWLYGALKEKLPH